MSYAKYPLPVDGFEGLELDTLGSIKPCCEVEEWVIAERSIKAELPKVRLLAKSLVETVPSEIFALVTAPSAIFEVVTDPSETVLVLVDRTPLASLSAVIVPAAIFAAVIEAS